MKVAPLAGVAKPVAVRITKVIRVSEILPKLAQSRRFFDVRIFLKDRVKVA